LDCPKGLSSDICLEHTSVQIMRANILILQCNGYSYV